jgi:hypothetical protein
MSFLIQQPISSQLTAVVLVVQQAAHAMYAMLTWIETVHVT